ncbi:MAG: hypothetical protein PCFJNLEI_01780 [Verrucomicrobiae bacterium]|nr:hypothetical protein [Verrucomicrobiae bacterium]
MRPLLLIFCGVFGLVAFSHASETLGDGARVIVTEENDKFIKPSTDKHYTQGLHLTVLWPDERVPFWGNPLSHLPNLGVAEPTRKYGFRIGQDIYTPEDTAARTLIVDDRPYAGWLYLGLIRESRGTVGRGIPVVDTLTVDAGVIGPLAQADSSQIWFHGLIEVDQPNGWRNQLDDEPAFLINYNRKFLLWDSAPPTDAFHVQLLPHVGVKIGTIETSATLGTTLRFGANFPNEFAKASPARLGWYVFGSTEARAVAYNTFLDGNLYHDSHSVSKEPVVLRLRAGVAVILYRIELSYTYNYLTHEFKKQDTYDAYASLNLTYHF